MYEMMGDVNLLKEINDLLEFLKSSDPYLYYEKIKNEINTESNLLKDLVEKSIRKYIYENLNNHLNLSRVIDFNLKLPNDEIFIGIEKLTEKTNNIIKIIRTLEEYDFEVDSHNDTKIENRIDKIEKNLFTDLFNLFPFHQFASELKAVYFIDDFDHNIKFLNSKFFTFKIIKSDVSIQQKMRNLFSIFENIDIDRNDLKNYIELKINYQSNVKVLLNDDIIDKYSLIFRLIYKTKFVLEKLKCKILGPEKVFKQKIYLHRAICFINSFLFYLKNIYFEREFDDLIEKMNTVILAC